uniref:Uncharacterized protein n=1 Tax=Eutreptiella gymnastica TaxID=73025 RepID=A0A7S1NMZ2_9EUGL
MARLLMGCQLQSSTRGWGIDDASFDRFRMYSPVAAATYHVLKHFKYQSTSLEENAQGAIVLSAAPCAPGLGKRQQADQGAHTVEGYFFCGVHSRPNRQGAQL